MHTHIHSFSESRLIAFGLEINPFKEGPKKEPIPSSETKAPKNVETDRQELASKRQEAEQKASEDDQKKVKDIEQKMEQTEEKIDWKILSQKGADNVDKGDVVVIKGKETFVVKRVGKGFILAGAGRTREFEDMVDVQTYWPKKEGFTLKQVTEADLAAIKAAHNEQ